MTQHQAPDLVGHGGQQLVALGRRKTALGDDRIDQNLDVDLVVRAVDAGRVVDGIGIQAPALKRVFDAPQLCRSQVGALAEDLAADFGTVDADGIIGAVTDVEVGFGRRLDVGTDAAEPQKVEFRFQHMSQQLVRRHLILRDLEKGAYFRRQMQRFGAALIDRAARRNQFFVIVGPGRARQPEHPLAFG